ncbi:MAG: exopolysaccharide biosynthesis polyprenyl glycosylphosphotransferase [Lachnospiraceae bacterium]|nr:exopolysaccharide biosynthesis polyprenyl glycosylphosphotransferase [Lachnospiraceae bacterium]
MQIKGKYSWLKHLDFMLLDLLALFLAFILSFRLKFPGEHFTENDAWVRYILIVSLLNILITLFTNPYSGVLRRPYYMEAIRAFQLTFYNLALVSVIFFSFKIGAVYSRVLSFYMYSFFFVFSLLMKFIWKKLLISGKVVVNTTKKIPLFIIGSGESIDRTIQNVTAGDFQLYDIVGVHLVNGCPDKAFLGTIPVVGESFVQYILSHNISEVLVSVTPGLVDQKVYEQLSANGVGLNVVVESAIGFQPEDQYIQTFGVYKTLSVGAFSFTPGQLIYLGIKRLMDILFALIGLILLIPITMTVKVACLLTGDRAKIFYRQDRVGFNGKPIRIWKFRSMVPDAEVVLDELLQQPEYRKQWEDNQKFDNDPRITRVGRFLRKTSIDELPQFLNVLLGDMSLVGPRPLVAGELEAHGGLKLYQKVKPGITGWWGCNGRSNIDYRERLELEYYYVKHCSLYLDVLCIFRTILAVMKKDGAQ